MPITRRSFLQSSLAATALVAGAPRVWGNQAEVTWHDVTEWGVEGRGWEDQPRKRYFDRLPAKAEGVVRPPVWSLSRHSAGMAVRFQTDATSIQVDYELLSSSLAMTHMPATGVSGLDLYCQVDDGSFRWMQVAKPTKQHVTTTIVGGLSKAMRTYMMYLPLYNGVNSLKIGVAAQSTFTPLAPRNAKPLVFYGTSIMHGACASRPGMAIPAILGRRFELPTINLGFSGNGKMDPEMAPLLAELDPAVYCIDCLPNMGPDLVSQRAEATVKTIRAARPDTPILLVEDRIFTNARFFPAKQEFHKANHRALRQAYESLQKQGVPKLFYLPGDHLLGDDGEGATDGSHPSDLGFMRNAAAYESVLHSILD